MPESEQGNAPAESAETGSPTTERRDMAEKPAGFRGAQPPTQTDVEMVKDAPEREPGAESAEVQAADQGAAEEADAVSHASPPAAKPGEKDTPEEDDPDMKDMAVGPRPADDQAGG